MKKVILKLIYDTLAFFTRYYLGKRKPFVIGITGNVGKTSCRMILHKVLSKHLSDKVVYTSPKNFNSELGIIFSIFKIEDFKPGFLSLLKICFYVIIKSLESKELYDVIILEYGIDHIGDMDFLLSVARPNIGIFTKLGSIHVANFGSVDKIGEEKIKLLLNTKQKVYLNFDDEFMIKKYDDIKVDKQYFNNGGLYYEYIKEGENIFSKISFDGKTIKTNILGSENFSYIQLSYLVLNDFWTKSDDNLEYLSLEPQPGRFSIFSGINGSVLVDSTYNSGPESMKKMIENVRVLREKLFPDYKLGFVIGDMRELGTFSKELHEQLFNDLEENDLLISVGTETKSYFPENIKNFYSSIQAGSYLKIILEGTSEKYIILFKGSQNTIFMEEALKQVLLNKTDEKKLARQDSFWMTRKN